MLKDKSMANSPLESLRQEPKQAIDINQAMNGLLTSIAETVSAKTPTIGQLSNIRNILISVREANKDLNFVITPETTTAIEKTLSSVTLPDNFERKVDNNVLSKTLTVNSKIDQTVQTITNVIGIMLATEKNKDNIPTTQRIDKALVEVLVTLLGSSLKQFAAINIPKDEVDKNQINVSLSGNKEIKLADAVAKVKNITPKIDNSLAAPKDVIPKQIFRIGQIPNFIQKNSDLLATVPAKVDKSIEEVNNFETNKTTKTDDEVGYNTINPVAKSDISLQDVSLLLADRGKTATDGSIQIYDAGKVETKVADDLPSSPQKFEKVETIEVSAAPDITAKTIQDIGSARLGPGKPLGAALSLFNVTFTDLGLLATSVIRDFNTLVNAAELTLQMQSNSFLASLLGAGFQNTPTSGKTNTPTDANNISLRILQMAPAEQKPVTVYQQQDAAIDIPDKQLSAFQKRTFNIINSTSGTGFLKIYLNRGPKFSDSESVTQLIPFQFEPVVSGDAKAAEYSQVSTLARSQAAQVYRKSQERTISLQLDYVVVYPDGETGTTTSTNNSISASVADGMIGWSEDYIYNYVVRNLKNLILPNVINSNYRLAPPIIQVWYGGVNSSSGSSTGEGLPITFGQPMPLSDTHPTFRTNWYTYDGNSGNYSYRSYRSLWVVNNVSFEYKGGIVNNQTRRTNWVVATLSLIEISPSVTDNELVIWNSNDNAITPGQQYTSTSSGISYM